LKHEKGEQFTAADAQAVLDGPDSRPRAVQVVDGYVAAIKAGDYAAPAKPARLTVEIEITLSRVSDLLCSAFEGGSNYWYRIVAQTAPPAYAFRVDSETIFPHLDYPLNEGGSLRISDGDDEWTLDLNLVKRGLGLFCASEKYAKHFGDFLAENDDATTGDVFLQLCLFGDVIFG